MSNKLRWLLLFVIVLLVIGFFLGAKFISPDALKHLGLALPLPIFTAVIAVIDGFNPCNLFVIALLLGFISTATGSKTKIYLVSLTFITIVYLFYFLFMAAWLNIFKIIGFIDPLRITIAVIAVVAGIINMKELFFFRQGPSLTIQANHKNILYHKLRQLREVIANGSTLILIAATAVLAIFASLIELPCTAGFPIIYTSILANKYLANSWHYYLYLVYYNLVYIVPLLIVVFLFSFSLQQNQLSIRQSQIIKFIGGVIMLFIGLILLVAPTLII